MKLSREIPDNSELGRNHVSVSSSAENKFRTTLVSFCSPGQGVPAVCLSAGVPHVPSQVSHQGLIRSPGEAHVCSNRVQAVYSDAAKRGYSRNG